MHLSRTGWCIYFFLFMLNVCCNLRMADILCEGWRRRRNCPTKGVSLMSLLVRQQVRLDGASSSVTDITLVQKKVTTLTCCQTHLWTAIPFAILMVCFAHFNLFIYHIYMYTPLKVFFGEENCIVLNLSWFKYNLDCHYFWECSNLSFCFFRLATANTWKNSKIWQYVYLTVLDR